MAITNAPNITTISAACPTFPDGAQAITTNDVDTFSAPVSVYVGGSGNVSVRPANGNATVVFNGMPAGMMLPIRVIGVNATGTTATGLVAVY